MNIYIGVTDKNWYEQLKAQVPDEVNFWNPGSSSFRALQENELFLFKLHYPDNFIVGGGFFVRFTLLPPFLAWQAFGEKNGTHTFAELIDRIQLYRRRNNIENNSNIPIGCTILTEPFWFSEKDWLTAPEWSPSIVKGKTYTTDNKIGRRLYEQILERLSRSISYNAVSTFEGPRYKETLTKHRLGQGAFRVIVTDAYQRRCAITGEKTLPVLEAAHIMPFAESGPQIVTNGLLLKSDFHTLFDNCMCDRGLCALRFYRFCGLCVFAVVQSCYHRSGRGCSWGKTAKSKALLRGALLGLVVSFAFYSSTGFQDPVSFVAGIFYGLILEGWLSRADKPEIAA